MKKILLFIICLFILPISARAERYTISEFNLSIDIPNNYLVITVDNYKNNPAMEAYGISPEYMEEVFETYNAYLDAYDMSTGQEMFIVVNPVVGDYSNYSKDELEIFIPTIESQYKSLGAENINISVENINGINYFFIDYYQKGFYLVNYYLVYQNNGYNFQIQSSVPFTEKDKTDYRKIVDTIKFNDENSDIPPVSEEDDEIVIVKKTSKEDDTKLFIIIGATAGVIIATLITVFSKKKKKCPNCGMELNKSIIFCPNCGTKK